MGDRGAKGKLCTQLSTLRHPSHLTKGLKGFSRFSPIAQAFTQPEPIPGTCARIDLCTHGVVQFLAYTYTLHAYGITHGLYEQR